LLNTAVTKVDIQDVCLLAAAVFGFDQLHLIEVFDEFLDILPAGLFDVVVLHLLCREDGKIRGNEVGDQG
jgi:hypothetical protein